MSEVISVVALVSTFILGILQWRSSVREQASKEKTNGATALSVNAETLMKLSKRIDELEARDATKEARINDLEEQVKKWKRAYNKALIHIRTMAPDKPVPDFLEDTGELFKR
jgi:uncharacterized coiled-coil protein SlyX